MPPKQKPLDVRGYYRILKVDPEANPDEIRLATAMAKQHASGPHLRKIDEAWETLSHPKRRSEYDLEGLARFNPLKSPYTLAACVALLLAILFVFYLPGYRMRNKTFRAGETLVEIRTGREFGQIVRHDPLHLFPQGVRAPAYLVRLADGGGERWLPEADLQSAFNSQ